MTSSVLRAQDAFTDLLKMDAWVIGLLLNLFGSYGFNLSMVLLKRYDKEGGSKRAAAGAWMLFALSSLTNYVSFAFAASSLLAALGGTQLLANLVNARLVLGEKASTNHLASIALLLVGMTTSAVFAAHTTKTYSLSQLQHLYIEPSYVALESVLAVYIVTAFVLLYRDDARSKKGLPSTSTLSSAAGLGLSSTTRAMLYASASACVGTQSVLQSKVLAELIKACIISHDWSAFKSAFTICVLGWCLLTLGFWLRALRRCLTLFDATLIVPTMQCSWVLAATVQGMTFFRELDDERNSTHVALFFVGLSLTLIGIFTLARSSEAEQRLRAQAWEWIRSEPGVWSIDTAEAEAAAAEAEVLQAVAVPMSMEEERNPLFVVVKARPSSPSRM